MSDENQKPEKVVFYMIIFIVHVDVNILTKFTPKIQSTLPFKISNDIWFFKNLDRKIYFKKADTTKFSQWNNWTQT